MSRETIPSGEDDRPTASRSDGYSSPNSEGSPSDGDRSPDQPPRAGLKGAGRSRSLQSSGRPLSAPGVAERCRYVSQRPRAGGGFLPVLSSTHDLADQSSDKSSRRAQTSIDFVVGMSVFLLTVAFVVAFLPGVFEPFTASGEGDVLAADRTASLLAGQLLAEPTNPGALNASCTAEFFSEADQGMVDACRFDADAADLDAALGLGPATAVNVTIEENGTVRSANGVPLRAGSTPPESESVVVSRRVVLLDGEERDLFVRVW